MNAKRLLDISKTAEMLQCSVGKVRQMVIGDRTLAAVHEDYQGLRAPFELRGLRLFDVDDQGAITDVRTEKPAGWLRFDLVEVVRTLSERAHIEAAAVPLLALTPPALWESEPKAVERPALLRWSLSTPQRWPGYRRPLYDVLKAAHAAGKPCPNARDVLDTWALKPPPDLQVMPDGVKYNDHLGDPKEANLKAIQQAIKGLLQNRAG